MFTSSTNESGMERTYKAEPETQARNSPCLLILLFLE